MFTEEAWQEIVDQVVNYLPQLATSVIVFLLFWIGAAIARRVIIRLGTARGIDRALTQFLGRAARIALLILGIITAMGTAGVDVAALVTGLGLTGFALGFALKDVISNTLAGIMLIIYKPFDFDDSIKVSSFEGKVVEIDLRYTVLESDGKRIFVPNSLLFTNAISVQQQG